MSMTGKNGDRLVHLKQLLTDELKSEKPGLLYIDDLKLSINRIEECVNRMDKFHGTDYQMVK